jgi:sugar O-acyltransferase (sialic acid O-acetyltransferase NeuD family)
MWIYGGGGHAKVLIDCLIDAGIVIKGVFDDNPKEKEIHGYSILGPYNPAYLLDEALIIAVGDNATRRKLAEQVRHTFGNVSHPSALISAFSRVGDGSVIYHRAVIQSGSEIGRHVIINTAATVDHDCRVGDFAHLAPGVIVCGEVRIGEGTLIGAGATVLPGIRIGAWCQIGAGAVVCRPIPDFSVAVGIPAKVIRRLSPT